MNDSLKTTTFLISALAFWLASVGPLEADDAGGNSLPAARILLFVPDKSEIPDGYEGKLRSIALRAESFFSDGIEQWGWEVGRKNIFARSADEEIEVMLLRGSLSGDAKGRDALPVITMKALAGATKALDEATVSESVWWIFYHCPDHDVQGFRGGGGRSINAYPAAEGNVSLEVELGAKEMWPLNLKGCIHEFGHALGLPHIGPKPSLDLGNTLMGPINRAFAAKSDLKVEEPRVYLSEASAAMLAKHPLFSSSGGAVSPRSRQVEVSDLLIENVESGGVILRGNVASNVMPHTAVVFDTSAQRGLGDYWTRSYCGAVGDDGKFMLEVSEPFDSPKGTLKIFFCLEDGHNSAIGNRGVMQGGYLSFEYEGSPGDRKFTPVEPGFRRKKG